MSVPKCLTIAGSDSGGGAGIQADLKAFASLGCHGSSVIVAITAQNTKEVTAVHNVPIDIVEKQIDAVFSDIGADCVKIGMLSNSEIISCVAKKLKEWKPKYVVLDPVMVAASGHKLLEDSAIDTLKKELFPRATIVTPNIPEAEVLVGEAIDDKDKIKNAAKETMKLGCKSVLMKGGHLDSDEIIDYFFDGSDFLGIKNKKINKEGHGTGCTLASAIAAYVAKGFALEEAVTKSVAYVHEALEKGYTIGSEHVVLDHFHKN